jgi:hypothetical protein
LLQQKDFIEIKMNIPLLNVFVHFPNIRGTLVENFFVMECLKLTNTEVVNKSNFPVVINMQALEWRCALNIG